MRISRQAWLLAIPMALLAGASPGPAANAPAAPRLTSLTLTSVLPNGKPTRAPSTQAAIAPDGRYAAFQQGSGIYVRDLTGRTTSLVSDSAHGTATAPDISANGRLVSYEQDGQVRVADRRTNLVRLVTGTARDPYYAHVLPCPAVLDTGRIAPCGPRLSADGTTLAYPAELSPLSPGLSVTATFGDHSDDAAATGDLLDFGSAETTATVRYENAGSDPVRFTGVAISGQPFELGPEGCAGTLAPGGSCTVTVYLDPDACDGFAAGQLSTASPDPAGQSVLELTARCSPGVVTAATRGCPAPPAGLALIRAPALTRDIAGAPLSDAGDAEVGRPFVIWLPVSAPATVVFTRAGCAIQLVDPSRLTLAGPLPAGAPAACRQGERLLRPTTSSCTAYLLISPAVVAPAAALLAPAAYVTARGVRHVIVVRRDRSGAGDFAAAASTIVSTGIPGAAEPSVSADGRHVAFTAGGRLWLRDTGRGGGTTLASCLPRARPGPCLPAPGAGSPSVSGDGRRVAFASGGRIYVRSVTARTTVLVSADGYAPVMSLNATTVGYVSRGRLYLATNGPGVREAAGTAIGMPSLDAIGRLAAFPATGALLPDSPKGIASVYTFDRSPRLSPFPADAGFGAVLLGSGTRTVAVTVTDSGPGPGTVTGVRTTGPFRVTGNRCAGVILYGGARCAVTVTFAPSAPGRAAGVLTVTTQDDAEPAVTANVPVLASVPAPAVTVSPGVASSGETVLAAGRGFPPGQRVTLTWRPGLASAVAATSSSGTFGVYLVVFPHDVLGPRVLIAAGPDGAMARSPFLVQPGPVEPPFTSP